MLQTAKKRNAVKASPSNILAVIVLVLVFVGIGYYFGSIGLLAGGATVAVVAGRARSRVDQISDVAGAASDDISSSVEGSKVRVVNLESSASKTKEESRERRLNHDPDSGLSVERPKLRVTKDGEVD